MKKSIILISLIFLAILILSGCDIPTYSCTIKLDFTTEHADEEDYTYRVLIGGYALIDGTTLKYDGYEVIVDNVPYDGSGTGTLDLSAVTSQSKDWAVDYVDENGDAQGHLTIVENVNNFYKFEANKTYVIDKDGHIIVE